jgi:hypothetical protein
MRKKDLSNINRLIGQLGKEFRSLAENPAGLEDVPGEYIIPVLTGIRQSYMALVNLAHSIYFVPTEYPTLKIPDDLLNHQIWHPKEKKNAK